MPNNIVLSNPGGTLIKWGDATSTPYLTLSSVPSSGTVGVAVTGVVSNAGSVSATWAISTSPADTLISPSSGTLAAGANVAFTLTALASGLKNVLLTSSTPGATINGSPMSFTAASVSPPPPPPPAPAPSTGTPQPFTLTASGSGVLPFAIGYAMTQGHVPSGSSLSFTGATAKLAVLSTWPDGSARHGIIAGTYTSAGSAVTVTPTVATVAAGTALTGAAVQSAMGANTAVFDAGAFGSATFSGADFATPFKTHAATDGFIEAIYRKQIGSDAHLVAWLALRVWSSGAVEALPWIENGYLNVAGPTNKSATYSFTLGGTSRFSAAIDLPHHCRTPLVSGSLLSHWLAADPSVTPTHDAAYLMATELVPTYRAVTSSPSLQTTFAPLQQGGFTYSGDVMSSGGSAAPIGLLPQHDVYALTTPGGAFSSVVRNGYSAGRYPIHYRDETTNRPLRMSSYPTLVVSAGSGMTDAGASSTSTYTPTPSGTSPPQWDGSHHPSVGYVAYLLTGRFYFMEQVQFAATANYINITDTYRGGANGVATDYRLQTRNAAWSARTLSQALAVTPDSDTALRAEFINSVQATIDHFHGRYVAQTNNPFGLLYNTDYGSQSFWNSSVWQNDFAVAAFGYMQALALPIASTQSTKLAAFFSWIAQSVVGRMGRPVDGYPYMNAAVYKLAYSPSLTPDFLTGAGPWYADWAALWAATQTITTVSPYLSTTEGTMTAEIAAGSGGAMSMLGNLQPALAYCVRHGVSGAREALNRMLSASNWPALAAEFNTSPVWSVQATNELPSWRRGMAVGEWKAITGSAFSSAITDVDAQSGFDAFSGAAYRYDTTEMIVAASGGHSDSGDNRVTSLRLDADSPAWVQRTASTSKTYGASLGWQPEKIVSDPPPLDTLGRAATGYYSDGKPRSRHTYYSNEWSSTRNRVVTHRARFAWSTMGRSFDTNDGWNPDTNTWDAAGTLTSTAVTNTNVRDSKDRHWKIGGLSGEVVRYTPGSDAWATQATFGGANMPLGPAAYDSKRDEFFIFNFGDGQGFGTVPSEVYAYRVYNNGTQRQAITLTGAAFTAWQAAITAANGYMAYSCIDYDPINDRYLWTTGAGSDQTIYAITPVTVGSPGDSSWTMSTVSTTGAVPATKGAGGVLSRFRYVAPLRGVVMIPSSGSAAYFLRTS